MKYYVNFFVIILITFCTTLVKANESSSIVYINMDKVMKKSAAGKSLIEQLDEIHQSNIIEFKKIEDSLKSEESSLMSQKNILSEEEFAKKINLLKKNISDYSCSLIFFILIQTVSSNSLWFDRKRKNYTTDTSMAFGPLSDGSTVNSTC